MTRQTRYSPEVRSRAVRMVFEYRGEHASEWAAISSIASPCSPASPPPPDHGPVGNIVGEATTSASATILARQCGGHRG